MAKENMDIAVNLFNLTLHTIFMKIPLSFNKCVGITLFLLKDSFLWRRQNVMSFCFIEIKVYKERVEAGEDTMTWKETIEQRKIK